MPVNKRNLIIILSAAALVIAICVTGMIMLQNREMLIVRSPLLFRQTPIITFVEGECFYRENDNSDWLEAEAGSKIKLGFQVKTQRSSKIDIRLHKDTVVRITENSLLTINDLTLKTLSLNLEKGQLYGRFHRIFKDQSLNIRTPTTIAAVRGTKLAFEIKESGSSMYTDVFSLDGITEIINPELPEKPLLLSLQRKTRVSAGNQPTTPAELDDKEIDRLTKIINAINEDQVLLITNQIQFAPNTAEMTSEAIPELEKAASLIKSQRKKSILITGHTAAVGTPDAMYRLSIDRALAVKNYLVENGINESSLEIVGFGGEKPIADNDTPEGRALNRRVEFHFNE
ncbi:MAG: OmpA family protein [Spirochaetales bacterium]|nr:OmpA family protein [Spirochaetales bacterium]